jgi:hypothetical protein
LPPGLSPRDLGLVELAPAAGIDRESFDELIELAITSSPCCGNLAWFPVFWVFANLLDAPLLAKQFFGTGCRRWQHLPEN